MSTRVQTRSTLSQYGTNMEEGLLSSKSETQVSHLPFPVIQKLGKVRVSTELMPSSNYALPQRPAVGVKGGSSIRLEMDLYEDESRLIATDRTTRMSIEVSQL